jgi:hypothetical protein
MIGFDIDVSGEDLLSKDYSICVADQNSNIRGFKFSEKFVKDLCSRYGQGFYRYRKSKKGKANFKIRLYCISIYYLFKSLNISEGISLNICFVKLSKNSNAHKYSFLMRKDKKNKMSIYVNVKLEDFEKWLK